jgi:hypothetical protein
MWIDQSVYPDLEVPPDDLPAREDKADYVHRICCAWDFGIIPDQETFALFSAWKEIFDSFPLGGSPAYHTFRRLFRWEPVAGSILRATYEVSDLREGRTDPCVDLI